MFTDQNRSMQDQDGESWDGRRKKSQVCWEPVFRLTKRTLWGPKESSHSWRAAIMEMTDFSYFAWLQREEPGSADGNYKEGKFAQ